MLKTSALILTLLTSAVAFAGVHDSCHTDNRESRVFAIAYTGAIIDLKSDETVAGNKVYTMPALNYEQAFDEVCKVIDEHPELWGRPSREAVTFAVDTLWKKKGLESTPKSGSEQKLTWLLFLRCAAA